MLRSGMGFLLRIWLIIIFGLSLAACATTPEGPLSLRDQLAHPKTITLKLEDTPTDLLLVKAGLPDGSMGRFIIDTGATLSLIYPDLQAQLGLKIIKETEIRVHGMIASKLQPVANIEGLKLGNYELPSLRVAIIPRANFDREATSKFRDIDQDGIIGMDILSRFHLHIDKSGGVIRFIPRSLGRPILPPSWDVIELTRNPFLEDGRELRFMQLRIGNALTPALIDTGSQFNMMNWNTKRFPRLRAVKKRLRKNWEVEGAVGKFRPVTKILSKNARAGQKFWDKNEFLVLDFESLNVLGIDGKPFVIAGIPMFSEDTVLMDFQNDRMYLSPDPRRRPDLVTVY